MLLCLTACHRTLAKHLHTGLPWIKCFLRHQQNDANGTVDYLHEFVSSDIFRILGINVNSNLVQLTQPTTLPPNRSAHTHETEEGLDALLVACSQQYKQELETDALFLACRQQFEQELDTKKKLGVLLITCNQQYKQTQLLPQQNGSPTHQLFLLHCWGQSWIWFFNNTVTNSFCDMTLSVHVLVCACTQSSTKPMCSFAAPITEDKISATKASAIPAKTLADTKYCIGMWKEWHSYQLTKYGVTISPLMELPKADLVNHLTHFTFKVRKKDGSELTPDSLHCEWDPAVHSTEWKPQL